MVGIGDHDDLEPGEYPFEIDAELARSGEVVFKRTCSECHGTYGQKAEYPEVTISIADIGTDPVRLHGLTESYPETEATRAYRREYNTRYVRPEY